VQKLYADGINFDLVTLKCIPIPQDSSIKGLGQQRRLFQVFFCVLWAVCCFSSFRRHEYHTLRAEYLKTGLIVNTFMLKIFQIEPA